MFAHPAFLVLIVLSGVISVPFNNHGSSQSSHLGCLKCHNIDEDKINVHLVPHSHDDVGWLKTVDQYFFGTMWSPGLFDNSARKYFRPYGVFLYSTRPKPLELKEVKQRKLAYTHKVKSEIQQAGVQYIITSVVEALLDNADRRFVQVETAFFWKWWKAQNAEMQKNFKKLVDNGQIEIVNGGWSMNDEACVNYQSTIDQFTWGLRIINETVGKCGLPRIGWQIDPFGHSREQASLFAQLGYDGVFFRRLDHDDEVSRRAEGKLNFAWQGSANLDNSIIFGGIFPTGTYSAPGGYCWDYQCSDDPVNDDPQSPDYNIKTLVDRFVNLTKAYVKYYPTKNVIIAMGGDFQYEAAEMNYINMDKFIRAFKYNKEVNVIYSTPSCYIQAVHDAQPQLQLKTDDFFPYSNDRHSFWTGYFTSRPNSKRFERTGHNVLQAAKQLIAISGGDEINYNRHVEDIRYLREAMGILQHHDAITGTEKQHVANDYVRILTRSIEFAEKPLGPIVAELLKINGSGADVHFELSSCLLSNISICDVSQNSDTFVVVVYNPLAWPVTQYIRLPVNSINFIIQGPDGKENYDTLDPILDFTFVNMSQIPSDKELMFAAKNIPPMGLKVYVVTKTSTSNEQLFHPIFIQDDNFLFGDAETGFQIDEDTNLLKAVTMNGITINITQNFYYYYSETGVEDKTGVSSGAYLFRPTNSTTEPLKGVVTNLGNKRGQFVDEFYQMWNDGKVDISQIIRVYKNESYIEFDWLVGGINVDLDNMGKEIITRFSVSDFKNNKTFYTDSNGREMIKRALNYRPDYEYDSTIEPIASNYYPVTSKIVIRDENKDVEVAILTDRPEGGSSLDDGQIELMVHRRIIHDDRKGVDESLNETEFGMGVYVRGSHYLVIGSATKVNPDGKTTAAQERILAHKKLLQPWVGVSSVSDSLTYDDLQKKIQFTYSALSGALPENVNILTLEPWKDHHSLLLRLEHILEYNEDPNLSKSAKIDLNKLFENFAIEKITETTLGANEFLEDFNSESRYSWNITGDRMHVVSPISDDSELTISLTPMQIRTFIIKLEEKTNFGLSVKPFSTMMLLTMLAYIIF